MRAFCSNVYVSHLHLNSNNSLWQQLKDDCCHGLVITEFLHSLGGKSHDPTAINITPLVIALTYSSHPASLSALQSFHPSVQLNLDHLSNIQNIFLWLSLHMSCILHHTVFSLMLHTLVCFRVRTITQNSLYIF